jgi:hypothetical protein
VATPSGRSTGRAQCRTLPEAAPPLRQVRLPGGWRIRAGSCAARVAPSGRDRRVSLRSSRSLVPTAPRWLSSRRDSRSSLRVSYYESASRLASRNDPSPGLGNYVLAQRSCRRRRPCGFDSLRPLHFSLADSGVRGTSLGMRAALGSQGPNTANCCHSVTSARRSSRHRTGASCVLLLPAVIRCR